MDTSKVSEEVRTCLSYLDPSAPEEKLELALRVAGNLAASGFCC